MLQKIKNLFGAQDMTVGKPMGNILKFAPTTAIVFFPITQSSCFFLLFSVYAPVRLPSSSAQSFSVSCI